LASSNHLTSLGANSINPTQLETGLNMTKTSIDFNSNEDWP